MNHHHQHQIPIHHHQNHNNIHYNNHHHRGVIVSPASAADSASTAMMMMMGTGNNNTTTTTTTNNNNNLDGIKQLALKAVEAAVGESSPETLLSCLCRVNDVNECILKSSPQRKYGYVSSSGLLYSIEATSTSQHHFSTLHLQVFIWMVEAGVNFLTSSFFKALEKQIMIVSSSGGDVDLQVQSIRVLSGDSPNEILRVSTHMTLMEFIYEFIRRNPVLHFTTHALQNAGWNQHVQQQQQQPGEGTLLKPHTKRLLKIIEQAKAINPISSYSTDSFGSSSSPASVWSNLLFSEDFSDVKIVCLDRTAFPAHQCILSGSSPYFKTYFKGPWSKQKGDKQYETRVDSTILKYVLTYMYTGNFGISLAALTTDTVCGILQQAQEFQMAKLIDICCKILAPRINVDNIKKVTCIASTIVVVPSYREPTTMKLPPTSLQQQQRRQQQQQRHHQYQFQNNQAMIDSPSTSGSIGGGGTATATRTTTITSNNNINLWKRCAEFIKENSTQVLLHQDFCRLSVENPELWIELQNEISQSLKRKRKRRNSNGIISRNNSSNIDDDDSDDGNGNNNDNRIGGGGDNNNNNNDNSSEDMSSSDSE